MSSATAAVRERPILFSGRLVRAILDGRKTVTRRVIEKGDTYRQVQPGDRLWVRETWCALDREGWWDTAGPADRLYDVCGIPRRNGIAYRSHADADSEDGRGDARRGARGFPECLLDALRGRVASRKGDGLPTLRHLHPRKRARNEPTGCGLEDRRTSGRWELVAEVAATGR